MFDFFQQPLCGYGAWEGHCHGAGAGWAEPAYFRRDRQLSERHSQALRRHGKRCWAVTCVIVFENQGSLRSSASHTVLFRLAPASAAWQQWYHIDHGSSLPEELFKNSPLAWFQKVYHKRDGKVAMGRVFWALVYYWGLQRYFQLPETRNFFTFNDSPRCFPAQDSFAIHLVLLVTAHYCKGHAFLLGRDMWRDLLNLFQRAAQSLFPIHLSSSYLTKHKAFSKRRVSPGQLHWLSSLPLHHPSLVGSLQQCKGSGVEVKSFSTSHLQYF